jgi:ABC-type transport system substrate-binding protein
MGVAGLAIAGCGDNNKSGSTPAGKTSSPAGASPGAGDLGYPTSGWDKLTLDQMRTIYAGSKLKELPGQKKGPTPGGTLHFASQTPVTWDPTSAAGSLLSSYMFANNQLTQFKVNDWVKNPNFMEVEPVLAETMPEQPDDTTYTFKIRQGVKFQNVAPVSGRELKADDIVYCLQTYEKAPAQGPTFEQVDTIKALDDYTVQVKMKEPSAYFLADLAVPYNWIFSKEQHDSSEGLGKKPIGTGGYIFEKAADLANYSFTKNPDYFRKDPRTNMQLPYLDRLEGVFSGTVAKGIAAYRSGQLDALWPQDFKSWTQVMQTNPDSICQVTTPPPSFQPFIALRLDKDPFKDPRVRQGLSLLIDRDSIIKELGYGMCGYGYGQDWTYFGNEWPWTSEQLGDYMKYDPKKGKSLLEAAGVSDASFDFLYTQYQGFNFDVWQAVAAMWAQAGIKTTVSAPQDPATWQKQFYGGTYNHLVATGFIGPGWDPDTFAYQAMYSKSVKNFFKINDPKVDDLALKQRGIMDKAERSKVVTDLMNYDLDITTRIWLVTPYKINMRHPNLFSLTDTEAAWNPQGWGSCGLDTAWKLS